MTLKSPETTALWVWEIKVQVQADQLVRCKLWEMVLKENDIRTEDVIQLVEGLPSMLEGSSLSPA